MITRASRAEAVFTITHSATNNRLTVQELDGTRVTFGYDVTSQLTLEQRNGAQAYDIGYSYDRTGNRLTQTSSGAITNYNYNAANAQVLITPPTGAPTTQTFDPVGNLTIQNTGGALTTQTWSPENRLLSISNPDGSGEQSTYSADGLRKSRTSGGVTTNLTWDQQNLLLETDTSNVIQARYTDFPGYWGGLTSQNRSGTSSFYGYDSQGSVRILTNSAGTPTDTYVYTAFGVELLNGSGTINPFRYVGLYGYYMAFINLYYVRARWLDAVKGRWDSRAGIGEQKAGEHPYGYVSNSVDIAIDPSGMQGFILFPVSSGNLACFAPAYISLRNQGIRNACEVALRNCKLTRNDVNCDDIHLIPRDRFGPQPSVVVPGPANTPRVQPMTPVTPVGPRSHSPNGCHTQTNNGGGPRTPLLITEIAALFCVVFPELCAFTTIAPPVPGVGPNLEPPDYPCTSAVKVGMNMLVRETCKEEQLKMTCDQNTKDADIPLLIARLLNCIALRQLRENWCYQGGDQGHVDEIRNRQNSLWGCLAMYERRLRRKAFRPK